MAWLYAKNPALLNVQQTAMLRNMIVHGIIRTPPGKPTKAEMLLRRALGNGKHRIGPQTSGDEPDTGDEPDIGDEPEALSPVAEPTRNSLSA